jgi:hypothetical protein
MANFLEEFSQAVSSSPQASTEASRLKKEAIKMGAMTLAGVGSQVVPEPVIDAGRQAVENVNQMVDDIGATFVDPIAKQVLPPNLETNVQTGISPQQALMALIRGDDLPMPRPSLGVSYNPPEGFYGGATVTPQGLLSPNVGYRQPVMGGAGTFDVNVSAPQISRNAFPTLDDITARARLNFRF